jgi:signal transduction histidine kinase
MNIHPLLEKQVLETFGFVPEGPHAFNQLLSCISQHYYELDQSSSLQTEKNELLAANQELKQKVKELDQFAYIVSHDLKAPLRNISSIMTWIEEDFAGQMPEAMKEQFELIRSRIQAMENLIEGILSYSRSGRCDKPQWIVPNEICKEIIELNVSDPGVSIRIQPNMPAFTGQRTQFMQVMANLITNAIKHGGNNPEIEVGVIPLEGTLQFYVKDNGPGIPPTYHQRIFEIFQTLDDTANKGSGIGLAIVKKIVENNQGKVWVDSVPGQGATFYFTWPVPVESEIKLQKV